MGLQFKRFEGGEGFFLVPGHTGSGNGTIGGSSLPSRRTEGLIIDGSCGARSRVNLEAYILGTSSAFRLGAREQGSSSARPITLRRYPSHFLLLSPTS